MSPPAYFCAEAEVVARSRRKKIFIVFMMILLFYGCFAVCRAGEGPVPIRIPEGRNISSVTLRCHSGCGRAQGPPLHVQTASSQFLEAFDDVVYVWVVVIVYGILVPS